MDDERWTWWDNREGGPGEDEPIGVPRTVTSHPSSVDPAVLKAAIQARDSKAQPLRTRSSKPDTNRFVLYGMAVTLAACLVVIAVYLFR